MQTVIKSLALLAIVMMATFLTLWAIEIIQSIIMQSGTVSQVMSPDFDLERVMVEASE